MVGFSGDGESYFSLVVENEKGYFLLYVIIKEEVTLRVVSFITYEENCLVRFVIGLVTTFNQKDNR